MARAMAWDTFRAGGVRMAHLKGGLWSCREENVTYLEQFEKGFVPRNSGKQVGTICQGQLFSGSLLEIAVLTDGDSLPQQLKTNIPTAYGASRKLLAFEESGFVIRAVLSV